jgi:hypothetical protein
MIQPTVSPKQFAEAYGVSPDKVLAWIKSGDLGAVDIGNGKHKKRFRIRAVDIEQFEQKHAAYKPKVSDGCNPYPIRACDGQMMADVKRGQPMNAG